MFGNLPNEVKGVRPVASDKELMDHTPDSLKEDNDALLAGSNQVFDAVWDWARGTGSKVGGYLDRQKRLAWCDRAIRELREDRDAVLTDLGREMYRAFCAGEIAKGVLSGTDTFIDLCHKVEDFDTKIAAQEYLRGQIAGGEAETSRLRQEPAKEEQEEADEDALA